MVRIVSSFRIWCRGQRMPHSRRGRSLLYALPSPSPHGLPMPTSIQIADHAGIRELRLNRPDVHNAFDDRLIAELTAALQEAGRDSAVRVVVLTGVGASFSAGADLN